MKNLPILFHKNREISLFCGPSTWKLCIMLKLFDSCVAPILLYGCEVWGYENTDIIDYKTENGMLLDYNIEK